MSGVSVTVDGLLDVRFRKEKGTVTIYATVDPLSLVLMEHFPGHPVVPGFLQLHWVLACMTSCDKQLREGVEVEQMKFLQPLTGGESIRISAEVVEPGRDRSTFSITSGDTTFTSGRMRIITSAVG